MLLIAIYLGLALGGIPDCITFNGCGGYENYILKQINSRHTKEQCRQACLEHAANAGRLPCGAFFWNTDSGNCHLYKAEAMTGCTPGNDKWEGQYSVCKQSAKKVTATRLANGYLKKGPNCGHTVAGDWKEGAWSSSCNRYSVCDWRLNRKTNPTVCDDSGITSVQACADAVAQLVKAGRCQPYFSINDPTHRANKGVTHCLCISTNDVTVESDQSNLKRFHTTDSSYDMYHIDGMGGPTYLDDVETKDQCRWHPGCEDMAGENCEMHALNGECAKQGLEFMEKCPVACMRCPSACVDSAKSDTCQPKLTDDNWCIGDNLKLDCEWSCGRCPCDCETGTCETPCKNNDATVNGEFSQDNEINTCLDYVMAIRDACTTSLGRNSCPDACGYCRGQVMKQGCQQTDCLALGGPTDGCEWFCKYGRHYKTKTHGATKRSEHFDRASTAEIQHHHPNYQG